MIFCRGCLLIINPKLILGNMH